MSRDDNKEAGVANTDVRAKSMKTMGCRQLNPILDQKTKKEMLIN